MKKIDISIKKLSHEILFETLSRDNETNRIKQKKKKKKKKKRKNESSNNDTIVSKNTESLTNHKELIRLQTKGASTYDSKKGCCMNGKKIRESFFGEKHLLGKTCSLFRQEYCE